LAHNPSKGRGHAIRRVCLEGLFRTCGIAERDKYELAKIDKTMSQEPEERTLNDLIAVLDEDVERCHDNMRNAMDAHKSDPELSIGIDFESRQLIRAIFAYLEGLTFAIKIRAVQRSIEQKDLVIQVEHDFAVEVDYHLTDKGDIVQRPALINLSRNMRFAFRLYEKVFDHKAKFDVNARWWDCLQRSIKVRDRLTHPRNPEDLDVLANEVIDALEAREGYRELLHAYISEEKTRSPKNMPS